MFYGYSGKKSKAMRMCGVTGDTILVQLVIGTLICYKRAAEH